MLGLLVGWGFLSDCSQSTYLNTIFLHSPKGMLPLMHTNGSITNFILSWAKLSSVTGRYCILYSPSPESPFFVGIHPDSAQKSKTTHINSLIRVSDAGPLSLPEKKMWLITEKYFFLHLQSRLLHNNPCTAHLWVPICTVKLHQSLTDSLRHTEELIKCTSCAVYSTHSPDRPAEPQHTFQYFGTPILLLLILFVNGE